MLTCTVNLNLIDFIVNKEKDQFFIFGETDFLIPSRVFSNLSKIDL
jgi:hypothetical protein